MSKKPTKYTDWRTLYQHHLSAFGFSSFTRERLRMMNAPTAIRSAQARRFWTLFFRLKRIKARLEVEHEAKDASFCEAIIEALGSDGDE